MKEASNRSKKEGWQATHEQASQANPFIEICGERFELTALQAVHIPILQSWIRTPADLRWLAPNTSWPLTAEKIMEWTVRGGEAKVLRSLSDGGIAGYGEVNSFDRRSRETWIGHVIIAPGRRGRGLGFALVEGLLRHAFEFLKASRVSLIVFPENAAAVNCYLRAGFRVVGSERHRAADSRELLSLTRLEITAKDHQDLHGKRLH